MKDPYLRRKNFYDIALRDVGDQIDQKWSTVVRTAAATLVEFSERGYFYKPHKMSQAAKEVVALIRQHKLPQDRLEALSNLWSAEGTIAIPIFPNSFVNGRPIFSKNAAAYAVTVLREDYAELFCTWFLLMKKCGISGNLVSRWRPLCVGPSMVFVQSEAEKAADHLYKEFFVNAIIPSTDIQSVVTEEAVAAFLSQVSPCYF